MAITQSRTKAVSGRARLVLGLAAISVAFGAAAAYPERAVTLLVTYPPGGTVDTVARVLGPELAKVLGQPVIIENRGGAGGMIGGAYVARAEPDGYTLMLDASNFAQNPALRTKMAFDPIKAFDPVSLLLKVPNVLVVNPASHLNSVADVIKEGKNKTDAPYYASSGMGSAQHLAGELFNVKAGTHMEHVAYKGGGPAMIDVMGGQVPLMFASLGSAFAHIKNGKLKVIAVGGAERSKLIPDVPSIAESGVPGYASYEWNGIFVPTGTPAPIIQQLSTAFAQVLKEPKVQAQLDGIGADVIGSSPEELGTFVQDEISKWKAVAQQAKIQLD